MKYLLLTTTFIIFVMSSFESNCQNYSDLIMKKIEKDESYLWGLKFTPQINDSILNIQTNRKLGNLKDTENDPLQTIHYMSSIYYTINDSVNITPLAIKQYKRIVQNATKKSNITQKFIYGVSDLKKLYENEATREIIDSLINIITENDEDAKETYDPSVQEVAEKISDIRPDYISFAKIISYNHYEQIADPQLYAQASFPGGSLSISHNFIEKSIWMGLNSFGLSLGLRNDPLLSLHAYQNPVWIYGFFWLIQLEEFYIDGNINIQNKYDNEEIDRVLPIFDYKGTEINKPFGVIADVSLFGKIGSYDMPVLNLYGAFGTRDYSNPVYFEDISSETRLAYWSCFQWQITTSFFWNTDSAGYNKFKFDFGAGSYDIYKALYNEENEVTATIKDTKIPILLPVLKIDYVHDSEKAKFGLGINIFDNHLTLNAWLKLFEIGPSELRIDDTYISEPYGRSVKPWENKNGSNFIQLIYRYGLNI